MASKAGISGLAVAVTAVGGFLVYAGIRDVPLIDGLREITQGKTPTGKAQTKTLKLGVGSSGTTPTPTPNAKYSLGAVAKHVELAAYEIGPKFGIKTIGGWAPGSFDHPRGLALDFMIDNIGNGTSIGSLLAQFAVDNRERLGVTYVIYNMRIASDKQNWTWRPYTTTIRTGDWQHKKHVHTSFKSNHQYVGPAAHWKAV